MEVPFLFLQTFINKLIPLSYTDRFLLSPIFGQLFDKQYKIYIKIKEILSVCAEIYVILQDNIRNTARIIS